MGKSGPGSAGRGLRAHARPYRAGAGADILRHWEPSPSSAESAASRGFSYYAFRGWPIAKISPSFGSELVQEISMAEAEVRRLNDDPPRTQLLEAVARQLLRAEAIASSRIEGMHVSHRRLAEAAFDPEDTSTNARSVLANVLAMEEAVQRARADRSFTTEDLLAVHRRLFAATPDAEHAGALRTDQGWIGGDDDSPWRAEFIPVPESDIRPLLKDLCEFVTRDDLPVMAQAAIAHAQLETIHPFADGNGRVGRCLIHIVLRRRGLAPHYVPPISVALATRGAAYVRGLTAYREQKTEEWLSTFARAVTTASRQAEVLAQRIDELKESWRARAERPRADSAAARLIEVLPVHPVVDRRTTSEILSISGAAAALGLERLARADVVREVTGRRRDRTWECVGLFDLLDRFERTLATPPGASSPSTGMERRNRLSERGTARRR